MNIKFGLMTSRGNEKYNSCISINKNGEIESIFDKMHLFSFSGEDHFITGRTNLKSINWKGGWGLSICYDLRFPEIFQQLSKNNFFSKYC